MTQLNPFTGAVAQSPQVQRAQAAEKDRHVRRASDAAKATALSTDQFEHQVEAAEALIPIHDGDPQHPSKQRKPAKPKPGPAVESHQTSDQPTPRLDITG